MTWHRLCFFYHSRFAVYANRWIARWVSVGDAKIVNSWVGEDRNSFKE